MTQSQATLAIGSGESGGNDSDNSIDDTNRAEQPFKRSASSLHGHKSKDEVTLRRSHRDLASHRNSLAGLFIYFIFTLRNPNTSILDIPFGSLGRNFRSSEVCLRKVFLKYILTGDQVYAAREQGSPLSLGSIGSRKTVYLSDDDPSANVSNKNASPMLVYNRISTHINETRPNATPQPANPPDDAVVRENVAEKKKPENAKDKAVWYEYGCV